MEVCPNQRTAAISSPLHLETSTTKVKVLAWGIEAWGLAFKKELRAIK
jgi:hypothetical protein